MGRKDYVWTGLLVFVAVADAWMTIYIVMVCHLKVLGVAGNAERQVVLVSGVERIGAVVSCTLPCRDAVSWELMAGTELNGIQHGNDSFLPIRGGLMVEGRGSTGIRRP